MQTKGFFQTFFAEYAYEEWVPIFDWLFDDNKFEGWSASDLSNLTKAIKSQDAIQNGLYVYGKRSEVTPSDYNRRSNRTKRSIVIMVKGSGEAKDIVRHIRNGIAHGRAILCTRNSIRCIELIDFGKFGDNSERGGQTAYFLIPISFLKYLYSKCHNKS